MLGPAASLNKFLLFFVLLALNPSGKPKHCLMLPRLARPEDTLREIQVIERIREELGFQTHRVPTAILCAALSSGTARHIISGVELDTWQSGFHLHTNSGLPTLQSGGRAKSTRLSIYHPVVVISGTQLQLAECLVNAHSNDPRRAEVHGRALYRSDFPRGDTAGAYRGIMPRVQREELLHSSSGVVAVQVEIGVVSQIADSGPIRHSPIEQMKRSALP